MRRCDAMMVRTLQRFALTLLYFTLLVPCALVVRVLGRAPLRIHPEATGGSYWLPSRRRS
ncbi:uncharacterized protein CMC5_025580 [Chondromyces crocatus]|uniref:Uncharacterized protein n=2 Tax=Chondromyces crocatus TaxID=52 RepID=A0A0K1ECJ0_CHOCO|nr:uncharacterized protein CMC5_025580 [Chondromyces crocatus]